MKLAIDIRTTKEEATKFIQKMKDSNYTPVKDGVYYSFVNNVTKETTIDFAVYIPLNKDYGVITVRPA